MTSKLRVIDDLQGLKEHLQARIKSNACTTANDYQCPELTFACVGHSFASRFLTLLCSVQPGGQPNQAAPGPCRRRPLTHTKREFGCHSGPQFAHINPPLSHSHCQAHLRCFKHMRRAPKNIEIRTICWPEMHLVRYM